ncbi:hypothetical protein GN316_14840 [Xylophilus sp. Kf1]|nr:hypothetical protein [Xylophilus sp. Kf1]
MPSTRNEAARRMEVETRQQQQLAYESGESDVPPEPAAGQPRSFSGWLGIARHSFRAWWEFHPVRVVGSVAEPVLADYARQRPLKLIGIAAGVGAVLVVTRPWRLVSVGGLVVAALKSSQLSNFALSLVSSRKNR